MFLLWVSTMLNKIRNWTTRKPMHTSHGGKQEYILRYRRRDCHQMQENLYSCNSHFILQLTAKISENMSKDLLWRTTIWKRARSASVQINPLQPPPFLLFLDRWLPQLGRDPKDSVKWVSWVQSINLNTPLSPVKLNFTRVHTQPLTLRSALLCTMWDVQGWHPPPSNHPAPPKCLT